MGKMVAPLAPCLQSFECAVSASLGLHEARGWLDPGAGVRAGGAPFCHLEMPPSLGACRGGTIPSDVWLAWRREVSATQNTVVGAYPGESHVANQEKVLHRFHLNFCSCDGNQISNMQCW